MNQLKAFYMRHRVGLHDLAVLIAFISVMTYIAYAVDIFTTEGTISKAEETIELDEVLLLGVLLAIGLLIFGIRRYLEQQREMTRRRAAEHLAHQLAFRDPLTSLANRRQFEESLAVICASPPAFEQAHAVLLLDLNGFKKINDTYGHGIGDETLIIVAQRLLAAVRSGDLVARLGGDEFVILAPHVRGPEAANHIAERIISALAEPIRTGSLQHEVGTGIGISLIPHDTDNATEALRKADVALYRAKAERRSAVRFFEEEMDRFTHEREQMERALREALSKGHIQPGFRPSFDLRSGVLLGFEVMPRWVTEMGVEVPSDRFLPAAEDSGLIHELAATLLRKACSAARHWPSHLTLAIDILPSQIKDIKLSQTIFNILASEQFQLGRLELEVAESTIVRDFDAVKSVLGPLRAAGAKITLDNFGTGYSNLYHVQEFQFDKIKIDRRFTEKLSQDDTDRMIRALAGLGQGLGLVVSAESENGLDNFEILMASGVQETQSSGSMISLDEANSMLDGSQVDKRGVRASL